MQGFSRACQRLVPSTFSRDRPGCLMWLQVVIGSWKESVRFDWLQVITLALGPISSIDSKVKTTIKTFQFSHVSENVNVS